VISYRDTISDGTPDKCQSLNLITPSAKLEQAKEAGVPFVFVSRPEVFDMMANVGYCESSSRNGETTAGKLLAIMERSTLEYDNGYVIRPQNILSEIVGKICDLASNPPNVIWSGDMHIVVDHVIDYIIEEICHVDFGNRPRIVHVPSFRESLAAAVYRMSGSDYYFDTNDDGVGKMHSAHLYEENFGDIFGNFAKEICIKANVFYTFNELYSGDMK
jgi:hypothetical protein